MPICRVVRDFQLTEEQAEIYVPVTMLSCSL